MPRDLRRVAEVRRNRPHAAGIRALVAVKRPLMIHGGHHRHNRFAVAERQNADLRASQKLLNDNLITGGAEFFILHDGVDRFGGFVKRVGDDDTLTERQTVRLDDNGELIFACYKAERLGRVAKRVVIRRRDAVLFHQVLCKHLAAFNPRRRPVRSEGCDPGFVHRVNHAQHKRIVRRDDAEIDAALLCQRDHPFDVRRLDRHTYGVGRNAPIAGRAADLRHCGVFTQLADQRMFAAAAADHQNFHRNPSRQ